MSKNKSKTDTSKQRLIYVYLPTLELTEKWKNLANKANTSISKFVIEHVENSLNQEQDKADYKTRLDLINQLTDIKQENQELKKQNKMMDTVIDRLEDELRIKRVEPFVQKKSMRTRQYGSELIQLFKEKKEIHKEELLELLQVDASNLNMVKGIRKQIQELEEYGIITDRGVSWQWTP